MHNNIALTLDQQPEIKTGKKSDNDSIIRLVYLAKCNTYLTFNGELREPTQGSAPILANNYMVTLEVRVFHEALVRCMDDYFAVRQRDKHSLEEIIELINRIDAKTKFSM
ncbi:unnamed protein product [Protopolystoma xenopodis]|uniref:Uncharacterized protein n=1 Tax=Protopolystoma xenopodis TaxID=117903 RepID=A0A3S5B7J8_9PLAT|nr:unnamed protein product [Protopolystoma xenopodis]